MTEKRIFVAFDGTVFESSFDCRNYEREKLNEKIIPFTVPRNHDNIFDVRTFDLPTRLGLTGRDWRNDTYEVYIENENALDLFKTHYEGVGLEIKKLMFYNNEDSCWYSIDDLIKAYEEGITNLKTMRDNFSRIMTNFNK